MEPFNSLISTFLRYIMFQFFCFSAFFIFFILLWVLRNFASKQIMTTDIAKRKKLQTKTTRIILAKLYQKTDTIMLRSAKLFAISFVLFFLVLIFITIIKILSLSVHIFLDTAAAEKLSAAFTYLCLTCFFICTEPLYRKLLFHFINPNKKEQKKREEDAFDLAFRSSVYASALQICEILKGLIYTIHFFLLITGNLFAILSNQNQLVLLLNMSFATYFAADKALNYFKKRRAKKKEKENPFYNAKALAAMEAEQQKVAAKLKCFVDHFDPLPEAEEEQNISK